MMRARYKAEIVPSFPPYWQYVAQEWGADADVRLAEHLTAFEALEPRYVEAARRLPASLAAAIASAAALVTLS